MRGVDHNMRILVVEDVSAMRSLMRSLLLQIGFRNIREADNGEAALRQLREAGGAGVDLVITDWNMPYMTGLELLREIRSDVELLRIPVLMVTALTERNRVIEAHECGLNGYVVKPFNAETLAEKIASSVVGMAASIKRSDALTRQLGHTLQVFEMVEQVARVAPAGTARPSDVLDPMKRIAIQERAQSGGRKEGSKAFDEAFDRVREAHRRRVAAAAMPKAATTRGLKGAGD